MYLKAPATNAWKYMSLTQHTFCQNQISMAGMAEEDRNNWNCRQCFQCASEVECATPYTDT